MTVAGIDFGTTRTKAYWRSDGLERYGTADTPADFEELAREIRNDGVRKVRVTGTGAAKACARLVERFPTVRTGKAGAIDDEIRLQALGARHLMGKAPRKLLVAAVGTGVSYAVSRGGAAKRHSLGSCHGGGTMLGLGRLIGAKSFAELEAGAEAAEPGDLLVKHKLPETAGTPLGELVIAHFQKEDASFEEKCASVFNFAACSIVKDLAVLTSIPFSPKEIAVVGTVAESRVFRSYLARWGSHLKGCRLHFPSRGAFAAAVGAWAEVPI